MSLTYRQFNGCAPGILVDTLNLDDLAPVYFVYGYAIFKPSELHFISLLTPRFILHWYTRVYSIFAWTAFVNLRRELLNMNVMVNIITVAPDEHHGVWNQRQFNRLLNSYLRLTTKKYRRFALLFMYGEQNNIRLYRIGMVAIFSIPSYMALIYLTMVDIETLSLLLAVCTENALLTRAIPIQRTMNAELWGFIRYSLKNRENKQLIVRVAWWRHQMVDFP